MLIELASTSNRPGAPLSPRQTWDKTVSIPLCIPLFMRSVNVGDIFFPFFRQGIWSFKIKNHHGPAVTDLAMDDPLHIILRYRNHT